MLQKTNKPIFYFLFFINYIVIDYIVLKMVCAYSYKVLGFLFGYLKRKNLFTKFFNFFTNIKRIKPNSFYFKNFYYKQQLVKHLKKTKKKKKFKNLKIKKILFVEKKILKRYYLNIFNLNTLGLKDLCGGVFKKKSSLINLIFFKIFFLKKLNVSKPWHINSNVTLFFKFKTFKKYNMINTDTQRLLKIFLAATIKRKKQTFKSKFLKKFFFYLGWERVKFFKKKKHLAAVRLWKMKKFKWRRHKFRKKLNKFTIKTNNIALKTNLQFKSSVLFIFFKTYLSMRTYILKVKNYINRNKKLYNNRKKSIVKFGKRLWFFKKFVIKDLRVIRGFIGRLPVKKIHNNFKLKLFSYKSKKLQLKSPFPLVKRTFITKHNLYRFLTKFYLKPSKVTFKSILKSKKFIKFIKLSKANILVDINKPLLAKLRESRQVHWGYLKKGTLNERRYKLLLKKTLKKIYNIEQPFLLYILFQIFNRVFSWNHINLILNYKLIMINGKFIYNMLLSEGDVIESTIGLNTLRLTLWYKNLTKKYVNRIKRWSYFRYCQRINKFLKKKKKLPKILKKLPITFKKLSKYVLVDYSLSVFILNRNFKVCEDLKYKQFYNTSVLKLYNWRYRA